MYSATLPAAVRHPPGINLVRQVAHQVAVASGAFSTFLHRRVTLDDIARITAEQTAELARFVDQCNPHALRQVLSVLA